MNRSLRTLELMRYPRALALLALIAYRARWKDGGFNLHGLELGEALIGDFKEAGFRTRGQYRSALELLIRLGLITTKRTNRGTIAKLISGIVFDITPPEKRPKRTQNARKKQPSDSGGKTTLQQPSDNHLAAIQQPLTNKETRKQGNNADAVARTPDPQLRASCERIAATATDASLVEELQKHFPEHDVAHETRKYAKWCSDKGRTPSREGFVSWMLNARQPFKPRRRATAKPATATPELSPEEQAKQDVALKQTAARLGEFRKNGLRLSTSDDFIPQNQTQTQRQPSHQPTKP